MEAAFYYTQVGLKQKNGKNHFMVAQDLFSKGYNLCKLKNLSFAFGIKISLSEVMLRSGEIDKVREGRALLHECMDRYEGHMSEFEQYQYSRCLIILAWVNLGESRFEEAVSCA
mmetsp:Transcript_13203/g.11286  ORF Transcript_13203/g.11286 Transcript_13203/m.11286 type:complete len:114 (+) Transcript_13203:137-478(+)